MSSGSLPTLLRALVLALLVLSVLAGEDFYKVLGVSKGASDKEIKKAYPDKNSTPAAPQKFLDVGHAFEILSDPEKRKTYDKFGEEGLKQQQGGGGFHDPFDIFRNFGGGFNQQQGQRKGPGKVAEIEVDLEAIYKGDAMSFTIAKKAICDECDGSGARSDKDIVNCPHCEGKGIRLVRHQLAPGIFQQVQMHCDQCGAKGKITKHVCSVCKGTRVVDSVAELNLHIDRGVPEGTEVTFEGESDESPDHAAGDVVVRIKSKTKVGGFARKESNLIWKETLSVAEALLGFKRTVKGLDGHDIVISRTGVTQPGFVQVIPDEGLPIYHESGHGDLFVEYTVVLPSKISSKTQGLLSGALGYKIPDVTSGKTEL